MRTVSQASVGCVEAPDGLLTAAQPGRHGLLGPWSLPRAPAFSRFVMIRPVKTHAAARREYCCFCDGQGRRVVRNDPDIGPDNERTPGLCQMPTVRAEEVA
jgi:hypothetical protein